MNVVRGRILLVMAAALMWLSCLHGPAAASVISLLELVNGQNISVLDKTFSNWTVLDTRLASDDLGLILVEALEDQPANPGLRFTATEDVLTSADGERLTLDFQFTVTAPGPLIEGNSLILGDFDVGGIGSLSIFKDVLDPTEAVLASTFVFVDFTDAKVFDQAAFAAQQAITVREFIALDTAGQGDLARIETFEQRVSEVPLPATLTLLVTGLAALGLVSRHVRV